MGKSIIIKNADFSTNAIVTTTYEINFISLIDNGYGYHGNQNGAYVRLPSGWFSIFLNKSDCIPFVPTGFYIVSEATPNNCVSYSVESEGKSDVDTSTFIANIEPMNLNSDNKYYAEFVNRAVSYGINFHTAIPSTLKIVFYM